LPRQKLDNVSEQKIAINDIFIIFPSRLQLLKQVTELLLASIIINHGTQFRVEILENLTINIIYKN